MRAMLMFLRGLIRQRPPVVAWVLLLVVVNLVVPLAFWQRYEARVVIFTFLGGGLLMAWLTSRFGFTRILGLGHVLWLGMLPWLALRLQMHPPADRFGVWLRVVLVADTISLLIDALDIVRYLRGDRSQTAC